MNDKNNNTNKSKGILHRGLLKVEIRIHVFDKFQTVLITQRSTNNQ